MSHDKDVEPWLQKIYAAKQAEFNSRVDAIDPRKAASEALDRIDRHFSGAANASKLKAREAKLNKDQE